MGFAHVLRYLHTLSSLPTIYYTFCLFWYVCIHQYTRVFPSVVQTITSDNLMLSEWIITASAAWSERFVPYVAIVYATIASDSRFKSFEGIRPILYMPNFLTAVHGLISANKGYIAILWLAPCKNHVTNNVIHISKLPFVPCRIMVCSLFVLVLRLLISVITISCNSTMLKSLIWLGIFLVVLPCPITSMHPSYQHDFCPLPAGIFHT